MSDGAFIPSESVDPRIRSYTPTADGTRLLVVLGSEDPEGGTGRSRLATCEFDFTGCVPVTEETTGSYVVAAQRLTPGARPQAPRVQRSG